MLYRPFVPAEIYRDFLDYQDWKQRAVRATTALCVWYSEHAVGSGVIDRELYAEVKEYLKKYFYGKCAYCESDFEAVSFGDVEHYRPKLRVTGEPAHRGYYWLAYDERNLFPSCELCNRGGGKKNFFPVDGTRAVGPSDDLEKEKPVLLSPYEPSDCDGHHIGYDYEVIDGEPRFNGEVKGLSTRGDESIRIYDLRRHSLNRRRAKAQEAGLNAFKLVWKDPLGREGWAREWLGGHREHSTAVRAACREWWKFARGDTDRLFGSGASGILP